VTRVFAVSALLFGLIASGARAADWPGWLGPARDGASAEAVNPWKAAPVVVWHQKAGKAFSSPIVADGLAFAHALVEGKEAEEVLAFDAVTGKLRWRDSYPRAKYRSQLGAGPRATPCVADGSLFTYGITGTLSCYDVQSGKLRWRVNPYEANKLTLPHFGVCSSPIVSGGKVVVLVGGADFAVAAYDVATGKLAWKALDEPAGSASPTLLQTGARGKDGEIIAQTTLRMVGLDPADGKVRWEQPLVFEPTGVSPTPFAIGDLMLCTTQGSGTLAIQMPGKGKATPQLKWTKADFSGYFSTGTLGPDGTALIVTNALSPVPRADVRCLDLAHGDELWHKGGLGYFHVGILAAANGKLLLLNDAGDLTLADVTRKGYKQLVKSHVCHGTFCNPALAGGRLYVRDDKEVICLDLNSPTKTATARK
jgi:outer membrane protein assembly factor BamB